MSILYEDLSYQVRDCVYTVFKELGPGFLENIYQKALEIGLKKQGIPFETQKEIKVYCDDEEAGVHKLDLVVDGKIVIELKAVDEFHLFPRIP